MFVWKKLQGTYSLTQVFADLLSVGSNWSLLKIKTRRERPTGSCAVDLRDVRNAVFLKGPGTFSLV